MDDTIEQYSVFAKTPKGVAEINARSGALTLQARRVLIMIDGRRPVAELMAVVRTGEFEGIMTQLETHAMIEKVDLASLPQRDYEAEDFADTISLLQENAAALRSLPQVTAADLAPQPAAPARAPTVNIDPRMEPSPEVTAMAERAVATASTPRPAEAPAVRRPPTIVSAGPVMTKEMAAGSGRPGTLNGTMRPAEQPVRRPPTLTGARPAREVERTEPATAAADVSARPAAEKPVEKSAPRAEAAAPAATVAPATINTPMRTLEEEKRQAVSVLYSVLGPYGEQPAAKLQECTTLEALREQIKQAGRRVATFRGEKAAQDYLHAIGHA